MWSVNLPFNERCDSNVKGIPWGSFKAESIYERKFQWKGQSKDGSEGNEGQLCFGCVFRWFLGSNDVDISSCLFMTDVGGIILWNIQWKIKKKEKVRLKIGKLAVRVDFQGSFKVERSTNKMKSFIDFYVAWRNLLIF